MGFMNNVLLFIVIIGAVNIVILLIIKSKASKNKLNKEKVVIKEKSSIKIMNYEDTDLICMVENNLEWEYGYECTDKNILDNMIKSHRNVYSLCWFDKEIVNGGLGEYFFGYSNITINYIEEALEDINAVDILKKYKEFLVQNNVMDVIKDIDKRNVEEYSKFMGQFDFSSFNDFYNYENIDSLIATYIRENICDFSNLSEEELEVLNQMS